MQLKNVNSILNFISQYINLLYIIKIGFLKDFKTLVFIETTFQFRYMNGFFR